MLTVKDIVNFKFTGLLLVFGIAVGGVVLGPQKIRKRVHPPQVAWRFPIEMQNKVAFSKLRIYTGPEIFKKGAVVRIATIKGKDALRATTPWIRLHRGRNIHDLVLPSRSFDNLVMEIGGEFDRKPFLQTKIVSKAIADFWGGYLWVAALISTALLLPGVMLTALFKTQDRLKAPAVIWLAPFALVFHTLVFFSVILWRQTGHYPGAPTAVSVWVVCVLLTLAVTCRLRGLDALIGTTRKVFKDASFYLTIVLAATFIVAHDTPLPFQNLTHKSISGPKTFGAFRAHDPWFQYANALSIEEGVPLRTHYRKQVYRPEDREILPGIIAGFGQMVIGSISGYLGKSYLTYTIIGTACNALLVFPLLVLSRRFFPKDSPYLLMTLFSLNAYVIVYYYMTVFKMAGGALFLSALILLLYGHDIRSWILSGSVMALGTNMHAGVALGIPLFFWYSSSCIYAITLKRGSQR